MNGTEPPSWVDDQFLNFSSSDSTRSGSQKSWLVSGGGMIKVRLKHRAPDGLKPSLSKKYPISVQVVCYDNEDRTLIQNSSLIAFVDPGKNWEITEAIAAFPPEAKRFSLWIMLTSGGGNYQVSALDIVEVKTTQWFVVFSILNIAAWAGWILWAIRRQRGVRQWTRLSSLFATLWIISWGIVLVFPRTVDIPRPFFPTFNTPAKSVVTKVIDQDLATAEVTHQQPIPPGRPAPQTVSQTKKSLSWVKSHWGSRFLIHFGVMGLFAGVLLLLIPPKQAYPFIIAMAIGVELVPWIWLAQFDRNDVVDLVAYVFAVAVAVPVSAKFRRKRE